MPSKRIRWWIVWALFGSTVINYISRQTFSVLAPVITQELHLSHTDLSRIFSAFQISYAGMWLIGGVLLDIVGTRLGLALAVIWWSAISMVTGFANSVASFGAFRFLLGIGEGCNWPGRQQDRGRVVSRQGARRRRRDFRQRIERRRGDRISHRALGCHSLWVAVRLRDVGPPGFSLAHCVARNLSPLGPPSPLDRRRSVR